MSMEDVPLPFGWLHKYKSMRGARLRQICRVAVSIVSILVLFFAPPLMASYPPDPLSDIEWAYSNENSVAAIQSRFNAARTNENLQLGTSIPMLSLPSQSVWDSMADGERALWLINRERVDRGLYPLHGIEVNVTGIAQVYAQYLMDNNAFSHTADGKTPWQRLMENPLINACHDAYMAENLAGFWGSWTLPIERAVYVWMYDDSSSAWGHRHNLLWYPYSDNSGPNGKEGFMGIGRATGTFQGWPNSNIIVMDVFDPCSAWEYGSEIIMGDLNGNGSLGLEDAILGLRILSRSGVTGTLYLDREVDKDGRIGLPDVLYILQSLAGLR
jgi:uncharacterized protein YkwD